MNSRISDDIEERALRRRRGRKSEPRKSTRKAHRPSQIAAAAARVLPVEPSRVSPGEGVLDLPESLQEPRANHRTRSARVLAAKSNA